MLGMMHQEGRRSLRWTVAGFAHHDCRAAKSSEQTEYDQRPRCGRALLPVPILTRCVLERCGSRLRRTENASQEMGLDGTGSGCRTVEHRHEHLRPPARPHNSGGCVVASSAFATSGRRSADLRRSGRPLGTNRLPGDATLTTTKIACAIVLRHIDLEGSVLEYMR